MGFTVDPALIGSARRDGDALERLLSEIWPEAYRMAFGIVHDRCLAEDAAQESCAAIAANISALRSEDAFYAWMYRIIVRQSMLAAKKSRRLSATDAVAVRDRQLEDENGLDILDAVARLPLAQRSVFVLRYYTGFNSREIAAATGTPAATVRFRLMQARKSLQEALAIVDVCPAQNLEVSANV